MMRRTGIVTVLGAAALGAALPAMRANHAAASPRLLVAYEQTAQWNSGYSGAFRLVNAGSSPTSGWRLEFDLPAGQVMLSHWNGVDVPAGSHHVVVNQLWNGAIPPGGETTFGYTASFVGAYEPPSGCMIDGSPCEPPGPGPSPTPSPSPSPTATSTPSPTPTPSPTSTPTPTPTPSPTQTVVPAGAFPFAPYADMTLWPTIDLAQTKAESGVATFTMAFVVTGQTPCRAAWGGVIDVGDDDFDERLDALRAAGGDAIVSFGGAAGTELAQSCATPELLAAEYRRVVDRYSVTHVDFDIEGSATADRVSVDRRSQAIAIMQHDLEQVGRSLAVSLTLPVLPSGLTREGLDVVRSARDHGVALSNVNIMAMDYGPANAPDGRGQMGEYAIEAATNTRDQLAELFPGLDAAALWRLVSVTPMIGQNDVQGEVFDLEDAGQLTDFANQVRLGRLSMWSIARDRQCASGVNPVADPKCSGILQETWAFSHEFLQFDPD